MSASFRPGDVVVYRKQKSTVHPGRRASLFYTTCS